MKNGYPVPSFLGSRLKKSALVFASMVSAKMALKTDPAFILGLIVF